MADPGTDQHLLRIKPFNGTEFATWESNLKLMLEQHSVLDVLTSPRPNPNVEPEKAAEFAQNDIKARFIITQAVADHMQVMIRDQKTAKEMLESLRRDFGTDAFHSRIEPTTIHLWSDEETKRLLTLYRQMLPDLQAGKIPTKEKMMALIAKRMGVVVSGTQCCNRIKSLQRSYRMYTSGKGRSLFRPKFADLIEVTLKESVDTSAVWLDLNDDSESMDMGSESFEMDSKVSKEIYESTTLIPQSWSEEETNRLLELYTRFKPELVVGNISSQEKVMEIIARELGGHLTPMQCLNKFKNLRAAYKNYKKDPVGRKFKYAAAMEAIEGGDPDHAVSDENNDASHEIVIVGSVGDGDSNEGENEAAITFITKDDDDVQEEQQSEEEVSAGDKRKAWSHSNTVRLLGLADSIASQLGTHIRTRSRMWTLVARHLGKNITPDQCAGRWRTLERSYKRAMMAGRGHPYAPQMKVLIKKLNDEAAPSSKLITMNKPQQDSDDIALFLESFDHTMEGDSSVDQDGASTSPGVSGVYSLVPTEIHEEPEGDNAMWSRDNTLKLIQLYKHLKCLVGTFKIRTHKKMWQVIAENMGGTLTANKCENRWRVLERKYRKHLTISNNLGVKGRSIRAFEYFPEMDALLNWSAGNPTASPVETTEFAGVHLSSSTLSAPPADVVASSIFDTSSAKKPSASSDEAEDDLDVSKEVPRKLRILERMRRDKKAYYTQMVMIHRERLVIEQQRLEEVKRKNRILERHFSTDKRTRDET